MPPTPSNEPKETNSQFEKLLAARGRAGIDYAVAGGLAVILNGYPRLTVDIGILVHDAPENLRKLLNCLSQWGEGWARELSLEDFAPLEGAIRVREDFDLDIFTRLRGLTLDDFRPRLRYLNVQGFQIPFLSPEDLIYLKKDSGREKDLLDVAALKEILKEHQKK
jgi:hypothetical protein